jgi:predicted Fe-Mo cluster-binding NifX family protein
MYISSPILSFNCLEEIVADRMLWDSMVASEMGQLGFDALKKIGIDVTANAISVEESAQALKKLVRVALCDSTTMLAWMQKTNAF